MIMLIVNDMKNIISVFLLAVLSAVTFLAKAQNSLEVKGIVYDETGMVIPGATVYLKDRPGVGTATTEDGAFSLKAATGDHLVISFVGYKNFEKLITKDEPELVVKLEPESQVLEDDFPTEDQCCGRYH